MYQNTDEVLTSDIYFFDGLLTFNRNRYTM